jgi:hypothetical protein
MLEEFQRYLSKTLFQQIKRAYPLLRPKLFLPYTRIKSYAVLSSSV